MFRVNGTLSIQAPKKPRVLISDVALQKMGVIINECNEEVGWLGTVESSNNVHTIKDVFLFKQEVHGTTCEINEESVAQWAEEMLARPDGIDIVNSMKMWGHSHVRMQVSPSGQDEKQLNELAKNSDDFFIRIIANKNGDLRLDFYDMRLGIIYNCLQWEKESFLVIDMDALKAEIKEKVQKKVFTYTNPNKQGRVVTAGYNPYGAGYLDDEDDYSYGYKGQYGGTVNTKKKDNVVAINSKAHEKVEVENDSDWLDLTDAEELMAMYAFNDDEIMAIAQCQSGLSAKDYIEKYIIVGTILIHEASHVRELCKDWVKLNFGVTC